MDFYFFSWILRSGNFNHYLKVVAAFPNMNEEGPQLKKCSTNTFYGLFLHHLSIFCSFKACKLVRD